MIFFFKSSSDLKLFRHSLDLLIYDLLLVLGESDGHTSEVIIDRLKFRCDGIIALVVDVLSSLQVIQSSSKVEPLLDLLDFILSLLKFRCNGLVVLSISNPGILSFLEKSKSVLCLLLGVIPTNFNPLDVSLKELWFVRIFKD